MDVTLGAASDGGGQRATPRPVSVIELHRRLESAVRDYRILDLDVEHRLYVDGATLSGLEQLVPSVRLGQPVPLLEPELIVRHSERCDAYRRVYLCLQVTDWNGDVVVTMFVRAILEHELLQLEIAIHALPEVGWTIGANRARPRFDRTAMGGQANRRLARERSGKDSSPAVPLRPFYAALQGMRHGSSYYWQILLAAPWRLALAVVAPVRRISASRRYRSTTRRGGAHDYGADLSLREQLALGQNLHYNALIDTLAHAARLQHRLLRAFADYLKDCGIDPQEIVARSEMIINNINQTIINDLQAGAVSFGPHSTATGTYSGPAANPGGANPASGRS